MPDRRNLDRATAKPAGAYRGVHRFLSVGSAELCHAADSLRSPLMGVLAGILELPVKGSKNGVCPRGRAA